MSRLLALLIAAAAPLHAERFTPPIDPAAAWSTTYLLNTLFALEYTTITDKTPPAKRLEYFTSEAGVSLWQRATFARAAASLRGQVIIAVEQLTKLLDEQQKAIATQPKGHEAALATWQNFSQDPRISFAKDLNVASTFQAQEWRQHWQSLSSYYSIEGNGCTTDERDRRSFLQSMAAAKSVSAKELLAFIRPWSDQRVQCLVFALLSPPGAANFEVLQLLQAIEIDSVRRSLALKSITALRYVQLNQFSQSLRTLVDLQDLDPHFRLAYEIVQRIYSYKEKGRGNVALQSL